MRTIGLLPHEGKTEAIQAAAELVKILERAGLEVRFDADTARRLGRPDLACAAPLGHGLDLLVSLGGDGTLLKAARRVYPEQTPIFGINFGHLGFLAEVEAREMHKAMDRILAGDYRLEERLMVSALRQDQAGALVGLNDAVIAKSGGSSMISLEIILNGVSVTEFRADGLIVATPTGSTAYSLSAGGPIIHPGLPALVVTPVCAHSLHARPLVVGSNDSIAARITASHDEVVLVADGQESLALKTGDIVHFRRAEANTRLIRFAGPGFYDVLRDRFKAGRI